MAVTQSTATERGSSLTSAPDGWTFRAPRHGDLVACPYCVNRLTHCCDYCGDEGVLFAMDTEISQ
ncbi:hypothetical protein HNP32_003458 [Brevundimonas bullata]|uniref:Uncharacterized protein n=1 Tax=Brevundimonas bullata TaxID=13160 RepID=A0A7W7N4P7_9CAUL|nr:hypothetical protein [Brevundimonas bullata]MBB4799698.1 hypothetical protein [Brevundimonas bullata]MBB6384680.1 hypothetical protein [Brevundimonas bullata]